LGFVHPAARSPGDLSAVADQARPLRSLHVEIGHPLTGLIVRYRGWLVPRA
jgi:hypothetical protein